MALPQHRNVYCWVLLLRPLLCPVFCNGLANTAPGEQTLNTSRLTVPHVTINFVETINQTHPQRIPGEQSCLGEKAFSKRFALNLLLIDNSDEAGRMLASESWQYQSKN